jgi:hypothetical protein
LSASNAPAPEFRLYRRLVTWFVLVFVSLGSLYLMLSVGVTIYRQRRGVLKGQPVGAPMTGAELRGCLQELSDVTEGLQKHLESFHDLLGGYDPAEAQRWGDEGAFWRNQWSALGRRCRFGASPPPGTTERRELDQMVGLYQELSEIERDFSKELLRFGRDRAPRLDRVRGQIKRIGDRLARGGAGAGENKP